MSKLSDDVDPGQVRTVNTLLMTQFSAVGRTLTVPGLAAPR